MSLSVNEANLPPAWSPHPDVQFPAGVLWEIPLSVSDPDLPAQPLSLQASGLPPGFQLDTNTLWIVGTGVAAGDYPVTVTVSDGQVPPMPATLQFVIHLSEPFALTAHPQSGPLQLTFPAFVGETYRVEFTDTLASPDWHLIQEIVSAPTNVLTVSDAGTGGTSQRFYRVRWIR